MLTFNLDLTSAFVESCIKDAMKDKISEELEDRDMYKVDGMKDIEFNGEKVVTCVTDVSAIISSMSLMKF